MKKCFALLFLSVMICLTGYAQKGRQGVGVNLGGAQFKYSVHFGYCVGLKYENFLTDYIRLTPNIEYHKCDVGDNGSYYDQRRYETMDMFSIKVKSDFFLSSPKRVRPYFHTGIGYVHGELYEGYYGYDDYDVRDALNLSAGVGLDWRITYALSMQFEVAYDFDIEVDGCDHYDFGIGFTYYFK